MVYLGEIQHARAANQQGRHLVASQGEAFKLICKPVWMHACRRGQAKKIELPACYGEPVHKLYSYFFISTCSLLILSSFPTLGSHGEGKCWVT